MDANVNATNKNSNHHAVNALTVTSTAAVTTTTTSLVGTAHSENNNSNNQIEQPQTKRQKIEKIKTNTSSRHAKPVAVCTGATAKTPPPDIISTREQTLLDTNSNNNKTSHTNQNNNNSSHHLCSSLSSASSHSTSEPSTTNNSPTTTPCSSRATSYAQLLNVQNLVNNILPQINSRPTIGALASANSNNEQLSSNDEVDRVSTLPHLLNMPHNQLNPIVLPAVCTSVADMREFEQSLTKQCLCDVSERTLQKPFQSHYSLDANGQKRIANLNEWPTNKLLQFLSNLQLLFDIYLKQNSKGFICARIMDVCDALIRNDHNLIDEIIVLAGYNNAYVQFLAGRVLAAFLVIAKQELNDDWLRKIVDILFNYERLDQLAVQQIHFSLDIIKRIVEWKDVELHPLEDEAAAATPPPPSSTTTAPAATSTMDIGTMPELNSFGFMHFTTQQPTLENNYFAVHYRGTENNEQNLTDEDIDDDDDDDDDDVDDDVGVGVEENTVNTSRQLHHRLNELSELYQFNAAYTAAQNPPIATPQQQAQHHQQQQHQPQQQTHTSTFLRNGCHIVTLTDSESFDTTHLKCITIQKLENKWPALVKNMSVLMSATASGSGAIQLNRAEQAEHCILNFLQLWENIISVKANLSIDETRPFYAQLDKFELLLNQNLSCTVYKQMLCLFNEALCYGSTLALQDMLPDETCQLAHQIVRHVKDFSILESLPRRQPENTVSLIGYQRQPILFTPGTLHITTNATNASTENDVDAAVGAIEMDKTILQKMVLLVLKSIAVTVKEIRSDSSDSSIDSSDYDAYHDMLLIERSIRDVLSKLETFIKHTLEFHPECHFSKILIHLFDDQDDHLIESMVCTLDVTSGISFRNNAFPELVTMLNPVYTFLEFLKMTSNSSDLLLDLLVSNETCFLLYLLRFLKYIRMNWSMFVQSCHDFGMGASTLDEAMGVLIRLRLQITRLVSRQLYPYDISPVLRLLESCESLYEGNELS